MKTIAKIKNEKLAREIAKEIDIMNSEAFSSNTTWAIGEYLGMQVQIRITRDDDDLMGMVDKDRLIEFTQEK